MRRSWCVCQGALLRIGDGPEPLLLGRPNTDLLDTAIRRMTVAARIVTPSRAASVVGKAGSRSESILSVSDMKGSGTTTVCAGRGVAEMSIDTCASEDDADNVVVGIVRATEARG